MVAGLPRTSFEQRSSFYEDVEALITPGFLSHTLRVGALTLGFRSLFPGDLFLLRARVGDGSEYVWRNWIIATSVWMVDGYTIIGEPNAAVALYRTISQLPNTTKEILFSIVMGLFLRQNKAIDATEAYCYESTSRFKWKTHGGHAPGAHSGIPGVELLGTNSVQRMWTFYNQVEDERVEDDALWEGFKLTVSPHAPKGVKKIDAKDKESRKKELERQQDVRDKLFYLRVGRILPESKKTTNYTPNMGSKSVDDLETEMLRWVAGEDDWHDNVVADYKKQILNRMLAERAERDARKEALRTRQAEIEASVGPTRVTGYTAEQLSHVLKGRKAGGTTRIVDGPSSKEHLFAKYLKRNPDAGRLRVEGGKLVDDGENPIREPLMDLTDQVSNRQVIYGTSEDEE